MTRMFSNLAKVGAFGGGAGMYASNDKFRNSLNDFLFGKDPYAQQLPTMDEGQLNLLQQLTGGLGGRDMYGKGLNVMEDYMDPSSEAMQRIMGPYMQQFNEQIIPGLGERFAGMGANSGALSSSGFGQALGSAGRGLMTDLAGMKEGMRGNAAQGIFGQYNNALQQRPFGYREDPGRSGMAGPMINAGLRGYMGGGF